MIRFLTDRSGREVLLNFNEAMDATFAKRLDEGEYKSYPTQTVFRKVCELFSVSKGDPRCLVGVNFAQAPRVSIEIPTDYRRDRFNDIQLIKLKVEVKDRYTGKDTGALDDEVLTGLKRLLKLCGWYVGDDDERWGVRTFILEPRYPIDTDKQAEFSARNINRWKTFYHVSFFKYRDRILDFGLMPSKTLRKEFAHPDRIYLFTALSDAEAFINLHDQGAEREHLKRQNTRYVKGDEADIKYQLPEEDRGKMILFKVDLKKCMDDGKEIKLFHDSRWSEDDCTVFFTQNSIPPAYITLIDEFEVIE